MNNYANVKCPSCKTVIKMVVPTNKCIPFFECDSCREIVTSKKKCCVICEFSDTKCLVSHEIK
ncbi:MAG: hypothetical protein J4428_04690 [Candidatus Aenigmarchaeota archaeon]|nr:hypothetical protein [Candidatus Aenigmarchaeota archaeon]